jgi:hyaluronoglucosaminidase
VQSALDDLQSGIQLSASEAVHALQERLDTLDEACYHLKYRMENLALRQDLLPWIEVLEHWIWMTRRSLHRSSSL